MRGLRSSAVLFVFLVFSTSLHGKTIVSGIPVAKQVSSSVPAKYVVRHRLNLNGSAVAFADGSTIVFKGGSLTNGTIEGKISVKGVKKGSIDVNFSKNSAIANVVDIYDYPGVVSMIEACAKGFRLCEDIHLSSPARLKSGVVLDGAGHSVISHQEAPVCFYIIGARGLSFNNMVIRKLISPGSVNNNYAVFAENMSDVNFNRCTIEGRLQFTNKTSSDRLSDVSRGISFVGCELDCDLSVCPRGWDYGQDHIAFFSVKDITVKDCNIKSTNVNRVLKTSAYFAEDRYEKAVNCTDGILFTGNTVESTSTHGKQVWDMFCGTVNAKISDNFFKVSGYSCVFEDKAVQPKFKEENLILSKIEITRNVIHAENAVLLKFMASETCDSFVFSDNSVRLSGNNTNSNTAQTRTTGMYLQGYKSCSIVGNNVSFEDDACGLMFATVNFNILDTDISDNVIKDAARIYFASSGGRNVKAERFAYKRNKVNYGQNFKDAKVQLFIAEAEIDHLDVELSGNGTVSDYPVKFERGSRIDELMIDGNQGPLFTFANKDVKVSKMILPSGVVGNGNSWKK